MLPLSTQIPITNDSFINNSNKSCAGKTQMRPSSPRQFFARIYGHLENNSNNSNNNKNSGASENVTPITSISNLRSNDATFTNLPQSASPIRDTSYQSDGGSTSSPDISISDERCERVDNNFSAFNTTNTYQDFSKPHLKNVLPSTFVGLPFGFPGETPFSTGLTAFLARRRRKEGRQRRQRTTFSNEQTLRLEVEFHRNEYISRSKRFELAETLGLSETQIKIWFQNRRAKDKRIEKAQIDQQYRHFVVANGFMNSIMGHSATFAPSAAIQQNFYPVQQSQQINTTMPDHINNLHIDQKSSTTTITSSPAQQSQQLHHNQIAHINHSSKKIDDSLMQNASNMVNPANNYANTNSFQKQENFSGSASSNNYCSSDDPNKCNFKLINSF